MEVSLAGREEGRETGMSMGEYLNVLKTKFCLLHFNHFLSIFLNHTNLPKIVFRVKQQCRKNNACLENEDNYIRIFSHGSWYRHGGAKSWVETMRRKLRSCSLRVIMASSGRVVYGRANIL